MSFYSQFAAHYERVFPLREGTLAFLRERMPAGGRILDLGCGTGHYCGALADTGLHAVGIDLDPAMIAAARARYPETEFHALDMREAGVLRGPFDGAYCIGNVLPHLAPEDLGAFLRDLAGVLAPGAPFVVQTVNFDRLLPFEASYHFPDLAAGDGLVFRRRYEPNRDGRLTFYTALRAGETTVFAGEETLSPLRSHELIVRCRAEGFVLAEQHGDFQAAPFDPAVSSGFVLVLHRA